MKICKKEISNVTYYLNYASQHKLKMSIGECKGIREHKSSMYNKHACMQDFSSHASGYEGAWLWKK